MTEAAPPTSTWVVAVHARADPSRSLGAGVVIDDHRVLTCTHVLGARAAADLGVAFPRADNPFEPLVGVKEIRAAGDPRADVAVLELSDALPAGIEPAPLRRPKGAELVPRRWWAYGFPGADPIGNDAHGTVGADLSFGWARLDTNSRYLVERGFSGGGVWSPDYEAVIGLVGQARDNGDGRVFTLFMAVQALPAEKLELLTDQFDVAAAGVDAVASWGWVFASDSEAGRHWVPRSRGVTIDSERGYRFRGRRTVLTEIVTWLQRLRLDRKILVVTGSPGVGKSAVLARIVTTADPLIAEQLPTTDTAVRAPLGSIACAVHAKGKTALQVGHEIARAASAPLPDHVADVVPGIRDVLTEQIDRRFTVVVDALDESVTAADARLIIRQLLVPLVETCSDVGAQVLVGTRRRDDYGDLITEFGRAHHDVDLDLRRYFALDDLSAFAEATLQLIGGERPDNPYIDPKVARPLAQRIAEVAKPNFLIAGLIARTHGLHDDQPADPATVAIAPTVTSALNDFLARISGIGSVSAADALLPLAFAHAPGLTISLWTTSIQALCGRTVSDDGLYSFARGSAANFLVQTTTGGATYRLFHQALNDSLLTSRADRHDPVRDQQALTEALITYGRAVGWRNAPDYLLTALPQHAAGADMVDDLLADADYLLYANLRRLVPAARRAHTELGHTRARLLRLTPRAIDAKPAERASLFSIAEALDGLGRAYRDPFIQASYLAQWAYSSPRMEITALEGHVGAVSDVCAATVDGQDLLASAGHDGTVRVWDPGTGEPLRTVAADINWVRGVCAAAVDGRELLASAGDDGTVRVWDPRTGELLRTLKGHTNSVYGVCAATVDGRELLASAGHDGTVRVWDPRTGELLHTLAGHGDWVRGLCPVAAGGQDLLASAGNDGSVRVWDPRTGELRHALKVRTGMVSTLCAVTVDGRQLLASAGHDGAVRLWDSITGESLSIPDIDEMFGVCAVTVDGRQLLASAGHDGTVRIVDPRTGAPLRTLEGHVDWVRGVCTVMVDGRQLVVSGGYDGTVRLWDPGPGKLLRTLDGHTNAVSGVCTVTIHGRELLASAGYDRTVRVWDPGTGDLLRTLQGHTSAARGVCAITIHGRELLASAGNDGTVRVWDPGTGELMRTLNGNSGAASAVCAITVHDRELLASAGNDGTVRVWDPGPGELFRTLPGHTSAVSGLCGVTVHGRELLASAGNDGTVRLWDPGAGCVALLSLPRPAFAVTQAAANQLIIAGTGFLLGVKIFSISPQAA